MVLESSSYRVRPGCFAGLCDPRWLEISLKVASEVEGFNSAGIIIPPIMEDREIIRSARASQTWGVNACVGVYPGVIVANAGQLKPENQRYSGVICTIYNSKQWG